MIEFENTEKTREKCQAIFSKYLYPNGGRGMVHLENWCVVCAELDPEVAKYSAPEIGIRLCGDVSNHPDFPDNHRIVSSRVFNITGNIITTVSGRVYKLGMPDPKFVEWCKEHGRHVPTEDEPIKVRDEH
jgi:hypothetical protein